ncbi:MAG: DUF4405 domain-containing protein [Spirochaetota bacterium]
MKALMLRIVNLLLFFTLIVQLSTVLLFKVFTLYQTVSEIHEIAGYVMGGLLLLHIVLNWPWIRAQLMRSKK